MEKDFVFLGLDFTPPPAEAPKAPFLSLKLDVDGEGRLDALPDGLYETPLSPEEIHEAVEIITATIRTDLTPSQYSCVILCLKEGKNQTEIAATLNLNQSTVSQHLDYARRKIMRKLVAKFPQLMIKEQYADFNAR
jgi:DNA-directed RNA polymerase specialized sigma24 family protein